MQMPLLTFPNMAAMWFMASYCTKAAHGLFTSGLIRSCAWVTVT